MPQMNIRTDRPLASGPQGSRHFVVVEVQARRREHEVERAGLDLGIALDRSGSMSGGKIQLACEGVATSIRMLHPTDRFALVTFDDEVEIPHRTSFATDASKQEALSALRRIGPGGSTDLFAGYLNAAQQVGYDMREGRLTRVLLLTDGQANQGVVDPDEIAEHVRQLRLRGLVTSTIGVGSSFNEELLTRMASAGGGNSYYVDSTEQLPIVLAGEVGDALSVTERDVFLEVRVPESVLVEPMDAARLSPVPGGLRVQLGDLVSEQVVRVVFEVRVPQQQAHPGVELEFVLGHAEQPAAATSRVGFRYVDVAEHRSQPVDREMLRHVYAMFAARARRAAVEMNSRHDYMEAQRIMHEAHMRMREFAEGDPSAAQYLDSLESETVLHGRYMDPREAKRRRYESEHHLRDRDVTGRPRRYEP